MSTLPLQRKITPYSAKINIVEGNEEQKATKINPLIAWLVIPPLDDAQRLANENFARSMVTLLGASQLLFRHCDHFSSRALDLNKIQWWFLTDWHITVFMEIDDQFVQGDIYFYIDGSGTFVLIPDEFRLDVGGQGIELHPYYEQGCPPSLRDPQFGYFSQAMRLACAVSTSRRHWYVPKRKRSDWNPANCDQALKQLTELIGVSASNSKIPDIHVPHVSTAILSMVLKVLERRKIMGILMPRKQHRVRNTATAAVVLKASKPYLLMKSTQTEDQLASQRELKSSSSKRQGSITITILGPKKPEQKSFLQISEYHAALIPTQIQNQNQRVGPGCSKGTTGSVTHPVCALLNRPLSFEEWKISRGITIKQMTVPSNSSSAGDPVVPYHNVIADTTVYQPKHAEAPVTKQANAERVRENTEVIRIGKQKSENSLDPSPSVKVDSVLDLEGWTMVDNARRRARYRAKRKTLCAS